MVLIFSDPQLLAFTSTPCQASPDPEHQPALRGPESPGPTDNSRHGEQPRPVPCAGNSVRESRTAFLNSLGQFPGRGEPPVLLLGSPNEGQPHTLQGGNSSGPGDRTQELNTVLPLTHCVT